MDSIIEYDTVKELVANPPSLDMRPNFFNLLPTTGYTPYEHMLPVHLSVFCVLNQLI